MPWMTIPIATGLLMAGSTGAQVYQSKSASKQNKRAQELQSQESNTAFAIERERLADEKAARTEAIARDKERWQDYLRINEPQWKASAGVLGSLYDLAGFQGQAPGYTSPMQPPPSAPGLPPSSGLPGGPAQPVVMPRSPGTSPQESAVRPIPIAELMQLAQMRSTPATVSGMPRPMAYA